MRLVGEWKERLGLVGWEVQVFFINDRYIEVDEEGLTVQARVTFRAALKHCSLELAMLEVSDECVRWLVCHEMLHVALTNLREVTKTAVQELSPQAASVVQRLHDLHEEALVVTLTHAFEQGAPQ